jgi:MoxR-like ATPase
MTAHDQLTNLAYQLSQDCGGHEGLVEGLLLALLADGSVLLESRSSPAAGSVFRSLARSIHADSCRIPFVQDESHPHSACFEVYRSATNVGEFLFQPALIFSNLILLEEVNHAPVELQNALLSAIAEREVVVAGNSHPLPALFMVVATENSFLEDDCRMLSAEQCDRFLLHINLKQSLETIRVITPDVHAGPDLPQVHPPPHPAAKTLAKIHALVPQGALFEARSEVRKVRMPQSIADYISALTGMIRRPASSCAEAAQWMHRGTNTARGTHAIDRVARAYAWMHGRDYVAINDVVTVAPDCLRHRVILNLKARAEGKTADDILALLLDQPWLGDQRIASIYETQYRQ